MLQKLLPVRPTAPPPMKPLDPRSGERKDDFQQHLDDAASSTANKPAAKPADPAAKPAKADAKKSTGKATSSGKAKGKSEAKGDAEETTDAEANASDHVHAEASDVHATEDGDPEAGEAHAEAKVGHDAAKAKDADSDEHSDGETDAAMAEAAALAQTASAVKPVRATRDEQQKNGQDGQQGTRQDAAVAATAKAGVDAAGAQKGASSARVKAVGKDGTDDAAEAGPGDPAAALAEAALKASGGKEEQASDELTGEQPDSGAAPAAKKSGEMKLPEASWGAPPPELENKPLKAHAVTTPAAAPVDATAAASAAAQASAVAGSPSGDEKDAKSTVSTDAAKGLTIDATAAAAGQTQSPQAGTPAHQATNLPAPQPPEVQFADSNHEPIVTGVKAQLLPHGGSMQIRLDPPELGALKVMVEMRDGAMTATFQTSNEEATRLLSHSLNQLKHVLEGQGVSVERLQVQQAPKGESASSGGNNDDAKQQQNPQNWQDEHAARQEQQRKEVLRRMWRRVAGISDPIDVTA